MIKIKARLYVPSLLMTYGSIKHPPIFEKKFELDLTNKHLFDLLENNSIEIGKVYLRLKKVNRKKDRLDFAGEPAEVSVSFFEELKNDGWVFYEEAAKRYGFPCDQKNQEFQRYVQTTREQSRIILETISSISGEKKLLGEDQDVLNDVYLRGERTGS